MKNEIDLYSVFIANYILIVCEMQHLEEIIYTLHRAMKCAQLKFKLQINSCNSLIIA